jgi:hypothetical protein
MKSLICCVLLGLMGNVVAAPQIINSGNARVSLLELYTSEGCSSCPPAEAWLSALQDDPRLWKTLVPVNFHVDYWDNLGWQDPFDSPAYTDRQERLAARGGSTVYTPGFMLDGGEWTNWFNRRPLHLDTPTAAGALTLTATGHLVSMHYVPQGRAADGLQMNVALLAFGVSMPVKAGENAGSELHHDFLVVGYVHGALSRTAAGFEGQLTLPTPVMGAQRYALAGWVSTESDPAPLQATGGWLAAP